MRKYIAEIEYNSVVKPNKVYHFVSRMQREIFIRHIERFDGIKTVTFREED